MKKLYVDLCALKRPFDRMVSDRVLLEGLAVTSIFERFEAGKVQVVSSSILELENSRNPDPSRRDVAQEILALLQPSGRMDEALISQAHELETLGFQALDALYLASARRAGCDLFVTCDDEILGRARRCPEDRLNLRVVDPVEAIRILWEEEQG